MEDTILQNGYPSLSEIKRENGWPSEDRFAKGPVAIIECVQQIPCNPCENACPFGAIQVGTLITGIPQLDREKCTGCGQCVAACSGLAIFIVDKGYSELEASVSFPFEYHPLPQKGDSVQAVSRAGSFVCEAKVLRVINSKKNDHTPVVTLVIPKEHADEVRSMRRLDAAEQSAGFVAVENEGFLADDVIVCRCEEVTAGEIRKAIREHKGRSVTEIKRRIRSGMGLCQGKTCGRQVARILSEELNLKPEQIPPATDRPPVRPITFLELCGKEGALDD